MSDRQSRRSAAGISVGELCVKAGLSRSRLSLIESGYIVPAPEELARIDMALGCADGKPHRAGRCFGGLALTVKR